MQHHDCGQGSAMYMPPEALWWYVVGSGGGFRVCNFVGSTNHRERLVVLSVGRHFHNTRTRRASSAASMRKELVTVLDDASRVAQQKSDFVGLDGFKKHDVYSIGMLLLVR